MALAATFVVASCDDDSMNLDKAYIIADENQNDFTASFQINETELYYTLYWDPIYETSYGMAIMSGNVDVVDIFLRADQDGIETPVSAKIDKDRRELVAEVGVDELKNKLGSTINFQFGLVIENAHGFDTLNQNNCEVTFLVNSINGVSGQEIGKVAITYTPIPHYDYHYGYVPISTDLYRNAHIYKFLYNTQVDGVEFYAMAQPGYKFEKWSDGSTDNPRKLDVRGNIFLEAIFQREDINDDVKDEKEVLTYDYKSSNEWFLGGENKTYGYIEKSNIIVEVIGAVGRDTANNPKVWDDNLEIMFQNLSAANGQNLQKEEGEFLITFDITWNGEAETAGFRICSDADKYIEKIVNAAEDPSYYKDWDPWKLTDEQTNELIFNKNSELGTVYTVDKGQTVNVVWGGTITDRGANYIGIEINLAGYEDENGLHENGKGTFIISNFKVTIDDVKVFDMLAE